MNKKYTRLILSALIFVLLCSIVIMSWHFSEQSGYTSNNLSAKVAKSIENSIADNFITNRNDTFWKVTLNLIVRKAAHFLEYMLIGATICLLLNILIKKVWLSLAISIITCPIFAYIDEYRQKFSYGRSPRWTDVKIDTSGALLGILIITIVFLVFRYVQKLKIRINELESQMSSMRLVYDYSKKS